MIPVYKIFIIIRMLTFYSDFGKSVDLTRSQKMYGPEVVRAAIQQIQNADIFTNDHLFMIRMAYVESRHGEIIAKDNSWDTELGRGGIWGTKAQTLVYIREKLNAQIKIDIKNKLNIDITSLNFENGDLRAPLYSAIVERSNMYLKNDAIPMGINDQANYWKAYLNPEGELSNFKASMNFTDFCPSAGADILFVLDSSGSISSQDFQLQRGFVKNVINQLLLGENSYKIGVDVFSDLAHIESFMPISSNKTEMLKKADIIPHYQSSTYIAEGLLNAATYSFSTKNGMRRAKLGFPRVLILITDGVPSPGGEKVYNTTRNVSEMIRVAGVEFFSIGVGSGIDFQLLKDLCSRPKNMHVFSLTAYGSLSNDFISELTLRTCIAVAVVSENTTVQNTIGQNQTMYFQYTVPIEQGFTFTVQTKEGEVTIYLSVKVRNPSEFDHDYKATSNPNGPGQIYVSPDELQQINSLTTTEIPLRRKRQDEALKLETTKAPKGLSTVFLGVKGLRSVNNFSLEGQPGYHITSSMHILLNYI